MTGIYVKALLKKSLHLNTWWFEAIALICDHLRYNCAYLATDELPDNSLITFITISRDTKMDKNYRKFNNRGIVVLNNKKRWKRNAIWKTMTNYL